MALPQDLRFINDVVTTTGDELRPEVIDNFFQSNAVFAKLYRKGKVKIRGGDQIQVDIIYDKVPGGYYTGLGPFSTDQKETSTKMRWDWKQAYAEVTLAMIDVAKNEGEHELVSLVGSKLTNAQMTLADILGTALFNDGSDTTQMLGLRLATNTTGTYGQIARGTDTIGTAVKGNVDTTGGSITPAYINQQLGTASAGGAQKPDLVVTTQSLWDALWTRVQPQQRFDLRAGPHAEVGFEYISISGSGVFSDSHCPTGFAFGLNTNYIELAFLAGFDFYLRGPFPFPSQDGITFQLQAYHELIVNAPRLQVQMSGLTT